VFDLFSIFERDGFFDDAETPYAELAADDI